MGAHSPFEGTNHTMRAPLSIESASQVENPLSSLTIPDPVPGTVFVFGSNDAGRHGKGAALAARKLYGAKQGVGEGRTGSAYGIPTKDARLRTLSLAAVEANIRRFAEDAHRAETENTGEWFLVTRVGCGLAGFTDEQIAPLFAGVSANCVLPRRWEAIYRNDVALQPWLDDRVWHDRDT